MTYTETTVDMIAGEISRVLQMFYTPFVFLVGVIGNSLTVIVFTGTKLKHLSTSAYLTTLAISDNIYLTQQILAWLHIVGISDILHKDIICQLCVYSSYASSALSSWLVLIFTLERYIAVAYPFHRAKWCTVKRARIVVFVMIAGALAMNSPIIRFAKAKPYCNVDFEYWPEAVGFNIVDVITTFNIPLLCTTVLNVLIYISLFKKKPEMDFSPRSDVSNRDMRHWSTSQRKITRMLLVVSSFYIILNLPAYVLRLMAYTTNEKAEEANMDRWVTWQQISFVFFYTNFGINFLLYCVTGSNFRDALFNKMPCLKIKRNAQRAMALRNASAQRVTRHSTVSNTTASLASFGEKTTSNYLRNCTGKNKMTKAPLAKWKFDNSREQNVEFEMQEMTTHKVTAQTTAIVHNFET